MLEEEVDDHLAGVDFAVDFSDEPWSEVLISMTANLIVHGRH